MDSLLDLTQDALKPRGIGVDTDAFNVAMERQKAEARKSWAGSGEAAQERIWFEIRERTGSTEFLGYATEQAQGKILAIVQNGKEVDEVAAGEDCAVVVNQTPFYGESGGQVGDTGWMTGERDLRFDVSDTQKAGRRPVRPLRPGHQRQARQKCRYRTPRRFARGAPTFARTTRRRTCCTRRCAKRSAPMWRRRARWSRPTGCASTSPILNRSAQAEMETIEALANEVVRQAAPVETRLMAVDDAIGLGAMALFGEKYGEEVRVVSMGAAPSGAKAGKTYSLELCGGTHVANTGEIGLIRVVSEGAVAAGVRRIEALTGATALAATSKARKQN